MLHYLTIGFLDEGAVRQRRLVAVRPVTPELRELLARYLDAGDGCFMEGDPVVVTSDAIRCPWFMPWRNKTAERFAIEARETLGCTVAEVERARLPLPTEFA